MEVAFQGYGKMAHGEFKGSYPDGARCVVQEKIHGANAAILAGSDGTVSFASRRRIITKAGSFYDHEIVSSWLNPRVKAMQESVAALLSTKRLVLHQLDVVGELYGGHWPGNTTRGTAVQTMPLVWYSPRVEFAAFDVRLWIAPEGGESPSSGRYVDWPLAERLLERFGIPIAPSLGVVSREDAVHWKLPMKSVVRDALGHRLPASMADGLDAEGVVVKCEIEKRPVDLVTMHLLAQHTRMLPVMAEGVELRGSYKTMADVNRWVTLAGLGDRAEAAEDEGESGGTDVEPASASASGAGEAEEEDGDEEEARGEARWQMKLKCDAFTEAHGARTDTPGAGGVAKRIAKAYAPSKNEKVPPGLVAAVCERLTEGRMGSAVSKVGPPPQGAYLLLERWHGKPPMPLGNATVAAGVLSGSEMEASEGRHDAAASSAASDTSGSADEGGGGSADDTVMWAKDIAAELFADLVEELWRDEPSMMSKAVSLARKLTPPAAIERTDSDPLDNRLVDAIKGAGEDAGLSWVVVEAAVDPIIGAVTNLAMSYGL